MSQVIAPVRVDNSTLENVGGVIALKNSGVGLNKIDLAATDNASIEVSGGKIKVKAAGISDTMLASTFLKAGFVDRGDPVNPDKVLADWVGGLVWTDWDLSAIVPAGAKSVLLAVVVGGSDSAQRIHFRKNGNANENASVAARSYINGDNWYQFTIPCDVNRVIEYKFSCNQKCEATVMGWFF